MKRLILSEKVLIKIAIYLFTINISFVVLQGGFTGFYGMFGEMTFFVSTHQQESVIQSKPNRTHANILRNQLSKDIYKLQYAWLLRRIAIASIYYVIYWLKLASFSTPVILRVRMDN